MRQILLECWSYRGSLYWLTYREVRTRYRNAILGVLWAVLQPLGSILIVSGVMQRAFEGKFSEQQYAQFFACGIIPWLYFSKAIASASQGYLSYGEVLKRNYFPRVFVPAIFVFSHLADLLVGILFLCVWLQTFSVAVVLATVWLITFCFALSLWLAPVQVWFRDVAYALGFALQAFFFLTPILYQMESLPAEWRQIIWCNPLTSIVELFRLGFLSTPLALENLGVGALSTGILLMGGVLLFSRLEKTLSDGL